MKTTKIIITALLCCFTLLFLNVSLALAKDAVKRTDKTILFHSTVNQAGIQAFCEEMKNQGAFVVMSIPTVNVVVLSIPEFIDQGEIASDARVAAIEIVNASSSEMNYDEGDCDGEDCDGEDCDCDCEDVEECGEDCTCDCDCDDDDDDDDNDDDDVVDPGNDGEG